MNKIVCHIFTIMFTLLGILFVGNWSFSAFSIGNRPTIYTNNSSDAINTDLTNSVEINDPIREGAYHVVHSSNDVYVVSGIVDNNSQITTHGKALNNTLAIIKNVVNFALGALSLVALVYIIIQGIIILTAMGDDTKAKKGKKGIGRAIIAIAGIGLSRFIVSFIFWIINGSVGS